jgi:general secretion pathway protein M
MMDGARLWWSERSEREQWLLGVMLALLVAVILWYGVIMGLANGVAAARARHEAAVLTAGGVEARIRALKRLETLPAPALGAPAPAFVKQSASDAGIELTRSDPVGTDSVAISVGSAAPAALLDWLVGLEARGLFVDSIAIRANGDATVAAEGSLKVRAP